MSNELAIRQQQSKPSALALMASKFSVEPDKLLQTLKSTVFKGATNDELLSLVVVANEYGLNPLTKEIYAFPGKGGGITPIVSIDGWINMMNSHPQFDGIEFEEVNDADGRPISCTAVIYRKDRARPCKITEWFSECFRNTEPWKQFPHRMLRHKCISQGSRVAFGFSGVYDEDEAREIVVNARTIEPQKPLFSKPESHPQQVVDVVETAPESKPEPQPEPPKRGRPKKESDKDRLISLMSASGVATDTLLAYLKANGEEYASLDEISESTASAFVMSWEAISENLDKSF